MAPIIIPTAEPFYYPGGPIGCLLIHGFTGSPKEMVEIGKYLADLGYSVLGIRLSGHATDPQDMIRARYRDWLASVEDGWHILRGVSERIFVVGLSMGGVLALTFAANNPVMGVVAMSTPFTLPKDPAILRLLDKLPVKVRQAIMKIVSVIVPFISKTPVVPIPDWMSDHVAYPKNPVRAGVELDQLLVEMRGSLPKIMKPTLLIHSRKDTEVPINSMPEIFTRLGTKDKTTFWIENCHHVIVREPEKEKVFKTVSDFIARVSSNPG